MSIEPEVQPNSSTPARSNLLPVGIAVLFGFLANYLFFDQPLGISLPIFAILGLLALYGLAVAREVKPAWRNAWLAGLFAFFCIMAAVRAEGFTTFLNIVGGLFLALLLAHTFTGLNLLHFGIVDYIISTFLSAIEIGLIRPVNMLLESGKGAKGGSPRLAGVLRGLALALPILLVFTVLLSSADAAFEALVQDVMEALRLDNLPELTARLVFSAIVAWGILGWLAYALRQLKEKPAATSSRSSALLGITEAAVILGSVNALFALFVGMQFRYFFGGQSNIHVAGLTYAEYARRGFAELVVVAVFSLGLALVLQYLTRRDSRRSAVAFEVLAGLLVVLTGVILISAFQRMQLYEQAYGFTQLRFYVYVFMAWMGVLLAVFLVSLHYDRPRWFAFGLLVAGLGFIVTLNLLNTDAFIVRQNLARYEATGKLDAEYLASLSDDAIPGLVTALDKVGPEERQVLGSALHARLNELEVMEEEQRWTAWHFAHNRAYRLLSDAQPAFQQYEPRNYYWDFPID